MNPKRVGNIGEAKILFEFVKREIPVYIPYGDAEKTDLIADFNGKLQKIQIKTSEKTKDGYMIFKVNSRTSKNGESTEVSYTKEDIDYFAFYNIERDVCLLIPVEDMSAKNHVQIRYEKPKNNQTKGIMFEDKYYFDNIIKCLK